MKLEHIIHVCSSFFLSFFLSFIFSLFTFVQTVSSGQFRGLEKVQDFFLPLSYSLSLFFTHSLIFLTHSHSILLLLLILTNETSLVRSLSSGSPQISLFPLLSLFSLSLYPFSIYLSLSLTCSLSLLFLFARSSFCPDLLPSE